MSNHIIIMQDTVIWSLKNALAKITGFLFGFFFTNEILSAIMFIFDYSQKQIPSLFNFLSQYDARWSLILLILLLMSVITIVNKLKALTFFWWALLGCLVGLIAPLVLPKLLDKFGIDVDTLPIPEVLKKYVGG